MRAYHLALTRGEPGAVYNVGGGVAVRLRDALDLLLGFSPARIDVATDPARLRPSDVPLLVADNRALREATGWSPTIPSSSRCVTSSTGGAARSRPMRHTKRGVRNDGRTRSTAGPVRGR